jgi:hypothetical protein
MSIDATDLRYYESLDADSLGGDISATPVSSALNFFYDAVEDTEAKVGSVAYRCLYVKNESLDILAAANVYIHGITPSPSTHVELGIGTSGMNLAEQSITAEEIAPIGVVFTTPTEGGPLPIGSDMNPDDYHAVWMKRVVQAEAVGTSNDNVVLGFSGDQPAPP